MTDYQIEFINEVESTNDYLKEKIRRESLRAPYAVSAAMQTRGKGQRTKVWVSEPFSNVITSFLVDALVSITSLNMLNNAASLAVYQVLESYGVEHITIKWPNDVYVNDKKIAGILTENIISGTQVKCSIVGIGLNVNQTHFPDLVATSIKSETQQDINVTEVLHRLYECFYKNIEVESVHLLESVNNVLHKKNKRVTFEQDGRTVEYMVKSIHPNGNLTVVDSGIELEVQHHKVKWIG